MREQSIHSCTGAWQSLSLSETGLAHVGHECYHTRAYHVSNVNRRENGHSWSKGSVHEPKEIRDSVDMHLTPSSESSLSQEWSKVDTHTSRDATPGPPGLP